MRRLLLLLTPLVLAAATCGAQQESPRAAAEASPPEEGAFPVQKSEAEWKQQLTPAQFHVLREAGTERAFSSPLHANHEDGVYRCAACGQVLFDSRAKFDSGTGWPSFWQPATPTSVVTREDRSLFFMPRTEVLCARCGSHLGHVFDDGPRPTGLRYCMNGVALRFEKRGAAAAEGTPTAAP